MCLAHTPDKLLPQCWPKHGSQVDTLSASEFQAQTIAQSLAHICRKWTMPGRRRWRMFQLGTLNALMAREIRLEKSREQADADLLDENVPAGQSVMTE